MKRKTCGVILAMILSTVTLSGCEQTVGVFEGTVTVVEYEEGE